MKPSRSQALIHFVWYQVYWCLDCVGENRCPCGKKSLILLARPDQYIQWEYPHKIWPKMVLTYLYFRILYIFPLIYWSKWSLSWDQIADVLSLLSCAIFRPRSKIWHEVMAAMRNGRNAEPKKLEHPIWTAKVFCHRKIGCKVMTEIQWHSYLSKSVAHGILLHILPCSCFSS